MGRVPTQLQTMGNKVLILSFLVEHVHVVHWRSEIFLPTGARGAVSANLLDYVVRVLCLQDLFALKFYLQLTVAGINV